MNIRYDIIGCIGVIIAYFLISSKIIWGFPIQIIGCTAWIIYGKQINGIGLIVTNVMFIIIAIYGILMWM